VLVADDESTIRFVLREALEEEGCEVRDVPDGDAALEALASQDFQVAFLDIRMPGCTGLELLDRLSGMGSNVAVVIITAQNTFENAVEAMKRGALDYLVKPFGLDEVRAVLDKALRNRALESEVRELRREVARQDASEQRLVGVHPAMLDLFKTIGRLASRDISVLVTGESGTGKELVARAIHMASARVERPFIAVNTAAIPRELLESELFGHEKGAFTGAVSSRAGRFREASGGTLFLDEIGDMPTDLQAKLLRVLQEGEVTPVGGTNPERVDVRILAATHRDLDQAVAVGDFREDLLYRLRVVPIHIPPLRERSDDIAALAQHFVSRYAGELADGPRYLAPATLEHLATHDWPGNVRELENAVKRALVLSNAEVLSPDDFGFLQPGSVGARGGDREDQALLPELVSAKVAELLDDGLPEVFRRVMDDVERPLLETVLARTDGNQIKAASLLGINRNTLRKKIVDLGLKVPGRE
jgi:two-component system nitrogen regulation response regulator GlnG